MFMDGMKHMKWLDAQWKIIKIIIAANAASLYCRVIFNTLRMKQANPLQVFFKINEEFML